MLKWVIVVLVVIGLLWWMRMGVQRAEADDRQRSARARPGPPPPVPMVTCEGCGLNVPREEALPLQGRWFCCEEHRAAARAR